MSDVLDLGDLDIPDWTKDMNPRTYIPFREAMNKSGLRAAFMMHDIKFVRSAIRRRLHGEDDKSEIYRVQVNWPNGETAIWEFDRTIGWPVEDGEHKDWRAEWFKSFEGAA